MNRIMDKRTAERGRTKDFHNDAAFGGGGCTSSFAITSIGGESCNAVLSGCSIVFDSEDLRILLLMDVTLLDNIVLRLFF